MPFKSSLVGTGRAHPVNLNRGFTLIEIMVVAVIIAVMTAFLVGSLTRDVDRIARLESERFMVIVNEARDEAIISGEDLILSVDERSHFYQFSAVRSSRNAVQDDGLFGQRAIDQRVQLEWEVFEQFDETEEGVGEARVLISSLGEVTPFEARFGGDDSEFRVFINDENQLERETKDVPGF